MVGSRYKLKGENGKITVNILKIRGPDLSVKAILIKTYYEDKEILDKGLIEMLYYHRLISDNEIMRLRRFYGKLTAKAMEYIKWHSYLLCSSKNYSLSDIEVVDYRFTQLTGFKSDNARIILGVEDCVSFYLELDALKDAEGFLRWVKRLAKHDLEEVTE